MSRARLVVIGVGNSFRCDDAAGLEVARRLELMATPELVSVLLREGDLAGLIDAWEGALEAIIVDSASSDSAPGTIHHFDAIADSLPTEMFGSTHAFGVAEAVELGRALRRLPPTLSVYAIEGARFSLGLELSPEVEAAVDQLVDQLHPALAGAAR